MTEMLFPRPAYRVETHRLVLRCYEPRDAPALLETVLANRAHLGRWLPWAVEQVQTLDEKLSMIRRFRAGFDLGTELVYGVFDPATGDLIGGTGLHPRAGEGGLEIGYWISAERCGKGYATELSAVLTRLSFDLHEVDRVEIHVHPGNGASRRVPEKLGFQLEGRLRRRLRTLSGPPADKLVFSLLAEELEPSACMQHSYQAYDALGRPI